MRQSVLVIDDSEPMHALITARLRTEPVDLTHAQSGAEGLAAAKATAPDLILLDVDMPEPDGFEVCRQLKADPATQEIPVIFLTGASSTEQKLKGLELGAVDYITKPFDPAELRARVRASLRTKQLMDLLADKAAVLQASEEQFRFLAEYSSDVISRHALDRSCLYVSPACVGVLGYEPHELLAHPFERFVHPEDHSAVTAAFSLEVSDVTRSVTFRARRKDGRFVWIEATARALRNAATGALQEIHMTSRDVTSRKRAEEMERCRGEVLEMIAENRPLTEILQHLVQMVENEYPSSYASALLLMDGRLEHVAPNLPLRFRDVLDANLLGLSAEICRDPAYQRYSVVSSDIATNAHWARLRETALSSGLQMCWSTVLRSGASGIVGMFALYHRERVEPEGCARALLNMISKLIRMASEHRDLTYQLAHRAHHDSLTGLPNRLLFVDRLNQGLARAQRTGQMLGLFCIDLDRFKDVNDTLGHQAGDMLLVEFSRRVQKILRQTDTLARLGGDEFSLIIPDLKDRQHALLVAQKLMDVLKAPFEIGGERLPVTTSVGIAVFPQDGVDPVILQKNADVALYRAKSAGRNRWQIFTADMLAAISERLGMEKQLRRAVENNELELHYQPQYDPQGVLMGFEALLRWHHPEMGLVPPAKFIPLAEEAGLIVPIGEWVLNEACRQNKAWQQAGYSTIKIAVNVSTLQFGQPNFADLVAQILARHDLAPLCLELEITESLLMKDAQDTGDKLNLIRRTGVAIAVDDFGTGYSSLSYLQQLPIDTLKIDRSFVKHLRDPEFGAVPGSNTAVIRAILSLGHSLGLHVVAEGVETQYQAEFLRQNGCNGMQGYFFSKPKPAAAVVELLEQAKTPPSPAGGLLKSA